MLGALAFFISAIHQCKHHDEVRRGFQKGLGGIGTKMREGLKPIIRCAALIKGTLFGLGRLADLAFDLQDRSLPQNARAAG